MSGGPCVTHPFHVKLRHRGRHAIEPGPAPVRDTPAGRVPRLARLMALALHFEGLLAAGDLCQADVARLGHVTRARVTQILNLLHLAPDLQEEILFLPAVTAGADPIAERHVRPILREVDWGRQRRLWRALKAQALRRP